MAINYVFGYGSLINPESRARTGYTGTTTPVLVGGFQRAWNFVYPESQMTALGVIPQEKATTNGVLVAISEAELPLFDKRESGYKRVVVRRADITGLNGEQVPDGTFWLYVPTNPGFPSIDCPIAQSYVDVVLKGCLELGERFAAQFVRTTTNWEYPWIDDRSAPRYVRAMQTVPPHVSMKIDKILVQNDVPLQRRIGGSA
jgi:hypothetical protein